MTWSLALRHGDLDLSPNASLGTVTGSDKLVQDLRCFLLERMGSDDLHPTFGSLLDGGFRDGQYVEGVIGVLNDELAALAVETEIRRMVAAYQAAQLARARGDRATYGKATLTKGEVLLSLDAIDIVQASETMVITLHLTTGDDQAILTLGLGT